MASLSSNTTDAGVLSPSASNLNICNDRTTPRAAVAAAAAIVTPPEVNQDADEPSNQDAPSALSPSTTDADILSPSTSNINVSNDRTTPHVAVAAAAAAAAAAVVTQDDPEAGVPSNKDDAPSAPKKKGKKGSAYSCRKRIGKKTQKKRKNTLYTPVADDQRKRAKPRPREKPNYVYDDDIVEYYRSQEDVRFAIHTIFTFVLGSPREGWEGPTGAAAKIRSMMRGKSVDARTIKSVMVESLKAQERGDMYDASRKTRAPITAIKDGSKHQQMVADYRELGYSYDGVEVMINHYQLVNSLPRVTRSAIYTCEQRMKRDVSNIGARPQGSRDKETAWAKARYNFAVQFLVRLGRGDEVDLEPFKKRNGGTLPEYLKDENLRSFKLDMYKIVWWDEVHKDCFLGNFRQDANKQVRFPRNPCASHAIPRLACTIQTVVFILMKRPNSVLSFHSRCV